MECTYLLLVKFEVYRVEVVKRGFVVNFLLSFLEI